MATKKKFSAPRSNKKRKLFDALDELNRFSKLNVHRLSEEELREFVKGYIDLIALDNSQTPYQDMMCAVGRYLEMLDSDSGQQKVRSALAFSQCILLEKMSEVRSFLENPDSGQVLTFSGTITLSFDFRFNNYVETYIPEGFSAVSKLDSKMEGKIMAAKYFEIITYLVQELPPGRFKVCEKCGTPFFQATAREKFYCSPQCSKAISQAQYMERQREGGNNN